MSCIRFALIGNSDQVVAEYPKQRKNLSETVKLIMNRTNTAHNHKRTYTQETYNFHYLCNDGTLFFCVADADYPIRICYAFLSAVQEDFINNTTRNFTKLLKEKIEYYNNPQNDKVSKVQSEINEVKDIMRDNIDRVLERGERLEDLSGRAEDLQRSSKMFVGTARKAKRKMCMRNFYITIILIIVILVILAVVILIAYCFPTFSRCKS
eukprot:gb/GECH01012155.1/.p1 GENE.gb/GECH01012155.1/~~gb/GECH01012155.1/.p1  ORF type:complete len:209 (+),score=44.73 gb/GECH01012155.1/:1-627(+)